MKKLMGVKNIATTQLAVTSATALDQVIDFTVTATLVKVSHLFKH